MTRRRPRLQEPPRQLALVFVDVAARPPQAPATPEVMETLVELLLAALSTPNRSASEEIGHEPEDRR